MDEECDPSPSPDNQRPHLRIQQASQESFQLLASRVSEKLEEGDFKGAVRLACSEESVANDNESTIMALRAKHPEPHPDTSLPQTPSEDEHEASLTVCKWRRCASGYSILSQEICSGPDGLRPSICRT